MKNEKQNFSHPPYNLKYNPCFDPKKRSQIIYGPHKASIGKIIRAFCERKGVVIHDANALSDHIHMLVSIPPKRSVASFMGYLKGKRSVMSFDKHANLKYKNGKLKFGCRGYYVDTVGRKQKEKTEYSRTTLKTAIVEGKQKLFGKEETFPRKTKK
ncbi:IS200/IS605 family transposase, partial [Streptococcus pluranimalium]